MTLKSINLFRIPRLADNTQWQTILQPSSLLNKTSFYLFIVSIGALDYTEKYSV